MPSLLVNPKCLAGLRAFGEPLGFEAGFRIIHPDWIYSSVAGLEPHGHFAGAAIRPQRIRNRCGANLRLATHQLAFEHGGPAKKISALTGLEGGVRG